MEKKGRPPSSDVRLNIIEILHFLGEAHGYEIAKHYNNIFSKVTQRLIYYHLKKGIEYGIFQIKKIEKVDLGYSWGSQAERIMYELTDNAKPTIKKEVKEYFEKL